MYVWTDIKVEVKFTCGNVDASIRYGVKELDCTIQTLKRSRLIE
uniref:Uncharacterized protein n=1 Tax=Oryza sativa subsp. japonica TaxID=39947 RepID=Q10PI0_ORYSJ|nr:hypothetical protein LOC_Os03g13089 [Oryza sativa Japonica Group]